MVKISNKKNLKILVIDDEQGIRDLLSYELSSQGYGVVTARDGVEGIEKLKKDNFQLVITDIKMPRMDGVKTLEEIKRINPEIEVIMATGYGTIETAVASMKKGAYDFIQKPFNVNEILSLIEKALEKAELKSLIALYETSKAVFSAVKLKDLLPILIKLSVDLLKADDISIMLKKDDDEKLYIAASQGLDSTLKKEIRMSLGKKIIGNTSKLDEAYAILGNMEDKSIQEIIKGREDIKSFLACPLVTKKDIVGILCAVRTKDNIAFNASDQRYVNIFGSQISQAVENAKLYQKLEEKIKALNEAYSKLSEMQRELIQAEKLSAIGELASGVAHELNNPLTVVIGLVQLMLDEGDIDDGKKSDLEAIKEQAERCRKVILNLLQFARKHETQRIKINIENVVKKAVELVEYDFKNSGIELVREFESNIPSIEVDLYQMQQVFLNIINNAYHALEDVKNPKLIIKTKRIESKVQISFADNGHGIPERIINKIFDPFFTTKEVNKGTGLGLSISYGIIKEHNGEIRVQSKEGKGSTFFVEFPIRES